MTGYEIIKAMRHVDKDERCFIRWWRKENDFADYELVDTFLANLKQTDEFSGFELLTKDELWQELHRREPHRVMLEKHRGEMMIRWKHRLGDGSMGDEVLPFDAPSLMTVFDSETRDTTLC
jgi:hypothetical protein